MIYPLLSLFFILFIWQVVVTAFNMPAFILPGPLAVLRAFFSEAGILWHHTLVTLGESVVGLIVASLTAFLTALVMDRFKLLQQAVYPLLVISQTLPVMVLGPLLTLWFGFGYAPKIILVVLMSYFPIVVSFADSLKKISSEQLLFLQTMGAKSWQIYRLLKIPQAMSGFFSGLKVAATYCVGGAVVGEWLSAEAGLGYYMIRVKNGYQIDKVFASILCVIIISLGLTRVVTHLQKIYYKIISKGRTI